MNVLVTGGGGFLGACITRKLLERGDRVVILNRGHYPELEAAGAVGVQGSMDAPGVVHEAARGCDAIIHVAAKAGVWGPRESYVAPNVTGTERVLDACRTHGIQTLVYTSTPSVVHTGGDIEGGTSALPYATHFETAYPETKAIAEKQVLEANGTGLAAGGVLSTCALRPHLIWGPGDAHLLPRVLDRARSGRLRLVGGGEKLVDAVYVDNAADAHLAALDRLRPGAACAGKAYFVTNGEPWPQRDVINGFLAAAGLPPCERSISMGAAYRVGAVLEFVYRTFGIASEPPMTRFVANQLGTAHWYDISDIQADLEWRPAVSMEEGMRRLADALAQARA